MKSKTERTKMAMMESAPTTELLIQADGRILTHNLTSAMAEMLSAINPTDQSMKRRARVLRRKDRP
jgi:hypothetical protein